MLSGFFMPRLYHTKRIEGNTASAIDAYFAELLYHTKRIEGIQHLSEWP